MQRPRVAWRSGPGPVTAAVARIGLALGAVCLAFAAPAARAATARIDYLTIDANEGGSAGGHAAIRFGDRTFHFQHAHGGLLTLVRDPSDHFEHLYTRLGNRSLRVSRIAVEPDTYRVLRGAFDRTYRVQREQIAALDDARDDVALLAALRARARGEAVEGPPLRGAGLFERGARGAGSAALRDLAARIARTHGGDFAARRRAALRDALRRDAPDVAPLRPERWTATATPPLHYAYSRRMTDRMEGLVALEVLETAPGLQAGAFHHPGGADFALDPDEREALRRTAVALGDDLVALAASERPDWGFALLVGMARLTALEASLESGSWVFLDRFDGVDAGVPLGRIGDADARGALLAHDRSEWRAARALLDGRALRETELAHLEAAASRLRETRAGLLEQRPIRLLGATPIPRRAARRPDLIETDLGPDRLQAARVAARARERAIRARLESLYRYHLLDRNCVSEIFDTIDAAFGRGEAARAASQRRLGGHVATAGSLNFIPFVSERAVRRRYRVDEHFEIPSHRRLRMDEMRASELDLVVALRESNTVTSTVYRRNAGDSFFLFFTDDRSLSRPVLGAFNLVAAVGESALGLLSLPFDRGRTLWLGAKGVAMSLPELAFVNIRKGTHAWLAPEPAAPARPDGVSAAAPGS